MGEQPPDGDCACCGIDWIHVFERDRGDAAVFLRVDADIPLSRRPRERLRLERDGTATWMTAGPADGPVVHDARWSREGDQLVVLDRGGARILRVLECTADRLLVRFA